MEVAIPIKADTIATMASSFTSACLLSLLLFLGAVQGLLEQAAGAGECSSSSWFDMEARRSDPAYLDMVHHQRQQMIHEEEVPMDGYTVDEIWDYYLDCETFFEVDRPVHNESIWTMLRGAYQGVVGPARASITQPLSTIDGFFVDVQVKQAEGKGRGVFAQQDIPKGQLVYTASKQMAKFSNGNDYRRFLQAIPQDLACDVIQWAYVENLKGDNMTICVDLDEGSIINDGGEEEGNVGCDEEAAKALGTDCSLNYFALRDIRKGEEVQCIYAEFDIPDGWAHFGL